MRAGSSVYPVVDCLVVSLLFFGFFAALSFTATGPSCKTVPLLPSFSAFFVAFNRAFSALRTDFAAALSSSSGLSLAGICSSDFASAQICFSSFFDCFTSCRPSFKSFVSTLLFVGSEFPFSRLRFFSFFSEACPLV